MSTRALTIILEEDGTEICVLSRYNNGYPSVHGKELKKLLSSFTIVNGFDSYKFHTANSMNCLAAQIITHFYTETIKGVFDVHPAGTRRIGEEYIYTVSWDANRGVVWLVVERCDDDMVLLYTGPICVYDYNFDKE